MKTRPTRLRPPGWLVHFTVWDDTHGEDGLEDAVIVSECDPDEVCPKVAQYIVDRFDEFTPHRINRMEPVWRHIV